LRDHLQRAAAAIAAANDEDLLLLRARGDEGDCWAPHRDGVDRAGRAALASQQSAPSDRRR
jgi:hypothetical protein